MFFWTRRRGSFLQSTVYHTISHIITMSDRNQMLDPKLPTVGWVMAASIWQKHSNPIPSSFSSFYIYIYTKALADSILSSVQRSAILRVKPGLQVRIFYLFKMSSKMLIWYFELINYGNISPKLHGFKLNYSICWIRVYIYIYYWFSAFSMVYFIRWRMNIKIFNNFISIYSSKKETSLVAMFS